MINQNTPHFYSQLRQYAIQKIKPKFKTSKLFFLNSFQELHLFKDTLNHQKIGPRHQPYTFHKQHARSYRHIFLFFGCIFALLTLFVFFKMQGHICLPFFPKCFKLRIPICTLGSILSLLGFLIAYSIRADREALLHVLKKNEHRLQRAYTRKLIMHGLDFFGLWIKKCEKKQAIQASFEKAKDKLRDFQSETGHLLDLILKSKETKSQKETLFNQLLLECDYKCRQLVKDFEKK